jgi:hypothetical protein
MKNNNKKAWFKQFWPWFLIILPMAAVVAGISTLIIATSNKPDMVMDNYYAKGKAINADFTLLKNAQRRNIKALVVQNKNELIVSLNGVIDNSSINLSLFHSTLASRDISVLLTADSQGKFHFETDKDLTGKWQLRIEPFDKSWRLEKTVTLPISEISL